MRFGEYVRARREAMGLSLREFCEAHGFDPANTSKIERGATPPPDSEELAKRYGRALGLAERSPEMRELLDIAATERGKLPADLAQQPGLLKTLPNCYRALRVQKNDFENDAKDRFLSYVVAARGIPYITTDANVIVDCASGRNFDFELSPVDQRLPRMALEIFRLVDREDDVKAAQLRGLVWARLRDELERRNIRDYQVSTPARFYIGKAMVPDYCRRLADDIAARIKASPSIGEFEIGSIRIRRFEGLGPVIFTSTTHSFCPTDPVAAAEMGFTAKLADKDRQLPSGGYERVILALNWVVLVRPEDAISALASMDLSSLQNTDKVYFESTPGSFSLAYDKAIRAAFENGDDPPDNPQQRSLYHAWLARRIYIQDPSALRLVRDVSARKGDTLWIPDAHVREAVVWMGNELAKNGDAEAALWVARHFRRDPDPKLPASIAGDSNGGPDLHGMVERGERTITIATVRASVCWLLQRIVCLNGFEQYPQILDIVEELARDENLYVRQQATVPLLELANRMYWRNSGGALIASTACRQRVRNLCFEMLTAAAKYPAVLDWLGPVFEYIRDVREDEAGLVLAILRENCLCSERDVYPRVLIFYAVYRQMQYGDFRPFDASEFRAELSNVLRDGPTNLRARTVWLIGRILRDRPKEIRELGHFLRTVPDGSYDEGVFFHFFDAANAVPKEIGADLLEIVERAREKEREVDPNCTAFKNAPSVRDV